MIIEDLSFNHNNFILIKNLVVNNLFDFKCIYEIKNIDDICDCGKDLLICYCMCNINHNLEYIQEMINYIDITHCDENNKNALIYYLSNNDNLNGKIIEKLTNEKINNSCYGLINLNPIDYVVNKTITLDILKILMNGMSKDKQFNFLCNYTHQTNKLSNDILIYLVNNLQEKHIDIYIKLYIKITQNCIDQSFFTFLLEKTKNVMDILICYFNESKNINLQNYDEIIKTIDINIFFQKIILNESNNEFIINHLTYNMINTEGFMIFMENNMKYDKIINDKIKKIKRDFAMQIYKEVDRKLCIDVWRYIVDLM